MEQLAHDALVTVLAGDQERRVAVQVRAVNVGALDQQQGSGVAVAGAGGGEEGCATERLVGAAAFQVDLGALHGTGERGWAVG